MKESTRIAAAFDDVLADIVRQARQDTSHVMEKSEAQKILREHLTKFGAWSYVQLAERVARERQAHDCLEHIALSL